MFRQLAIAIALATTTFASHAIATGGCQDGPLDGPSYCYGDYETTCGSDGRTHPTTGARATYSSPGAQAFVAAEGTSVCGWEWADKSSIEAFVASAWISIASPVPGVGPTGVMFEEVWGERKGAHCFGSGQVTPFVAGIGHGVGFSSPCHAGIGSPDPGWGHVLP